MLIYLIKKHNNDQHSRALDDDDRHDELVGHARVIGRLHGLVCGSGVLANALGDRVVRLLHALPALVAIHRVVAAGDRRDAAQLERVDLVLQAVDILDARLRRGVAAVHEAVEADLAQAVAARQLEQREHMVDVRMHAAVRQQAEDVQRRIKPLALVDRAHQRFVGEEVAVLNGLGDAGQLLIHDAARADVGVADLGVAHLAVRQADVQTGGADIGHRVFRKDLVQIGGLRRLDGVALLLIAVAEAVHDDQRGRLLGAFRLLGRGLAGRGLFRSRGLLGGSRLFRCRGFLGCGLLGCRLGRRSLGLCGLSLGFRLRGLGLGFGLRGLCLDFRLGGRLRCFRLDFGLGSRLRSLSLGFRLGLRLRGLGLDLRLGGRRRRCLLDRRVLCRLHRGRRLGRVRRLARGDCFFHRFHNSFTKHGKGDNVRPDVPSRLHGAGMEPSPFSLSYWLAASTMVAKSALFREAPPIRPPSTSGWASSSAAFLAFIEPPYWMVMPRAARAPYFSRRQSRIAPQTSPACSAVAVLPVPIAQIGSYAMTTFLISSTATPCSAILICLRMTSMVTSCSRSVSDSPTHRIGRRPFSSATRTFLLQASSVSLKYWRRSEWPMMTYLTPSSLSISAEISPVNAPDFS